MRITSAEIADQCANYRLPPPLSFMQLIQIVLATSNLAASKEAVDPDL